jgi:ribosomal protein S18 acetylase RimI-like enzyme
LKHILGTKLQALTKESLTIYTKIVVYGIEKENTMHFNNHIWHTIFLIACILTESTIRGSNHRDIARTILASQEYVMRHFFSNIKIVDQPFFRYSISDYPDASLNKILDSNFSDDDQAIKAIQEIKYQAQQHRVKFAWLIEPTSTPNSLERLLKEHEFVYATSFAAMHLALKNIVFNAIDNQSINIKPLDPQEHQDWLNILATTFEWSKDCAQMYSESIKNPPSASRHYAGYYNGRLATAGNLYLAGQYAYIFGIATDPSLRNKGVATAMTEKLIREARDAGAHNVVLASSLQAESLYKKLGFESAFYFDVYVYRPNITNIIDSQENH